MTAFPQSCLLRTVRLTRTALRSISRSEVLPPKIFGRWQEKEELTMEDGEIWA